MQDNNLLQHANWVLTAVALVVGLSVALVAWLVSKTLTDAPDEDRTYKDPPPLGFRLGWWLIHPLSYYLNALISAKTRNQLTHRLRLAGVEYQLNAAQFIAGRLVCAALMISVGLWVVNSYATGAWSRGAEPSSLNLGLGWYLQAVLWSGLLGWAYPAIWLRDQVARRRNELLKSLPFYLDIITLCVEAGLNLQGAISQAVNKGPKGVLREEFTRVLRDIRAGQTRAVALRTMAQRLNASGVSQFVSAVIQAENMGMNLAPVLRAQSDQRRSERFIRAEKLAMQAPVKMLFPLIVFIFPCTFIVLFFPIVMKFMNSGL
jgi:tight adherence protein C